jgi:HAAS domain-containing protein
MIQDYLERLARELSFDSSLARNVRQEVEDHLWEAVAADSTGNTLTAQQRAIAKFGDARVIAAQFAVVSLARHSRRAGIAAVLVIASVFIAMKARIAWYAAAQWAISDDMRAFSGLVIRIDRYAFWLAVIIGLCGWAYIVSRRIPAAFHPVYRRQLRRFFLLCGSAAAALVVSVISDGVLTALLLRGTELSWEVLVPIFSMAIEIACVGILVFQIRGITHRAASTAALLNT